MRTLFIIRHGRPSRDGIDDVGRHQARLAAQAVLAECVKDAAGSAPLPPIVLHSAPAGRAQATAAAMRVAFADADAHREPEVFPEDTLDVPDDRAATERMIATVRALLADGTAVHVCVTHEPNAVLVARAFNLPITSIGHCGVVKVAIPTDGGAPIATRIP